MHEFIYKQAKENALSSGMGCFMKGTLVETEGRLDADRRTEGRRFGDVSP